MISPSSTPQFRVGHASEGAHWYLPSVNGEAPRAAYEILGLNGEWRSTTLRDARKHGLLPSVTTIAKVIARPGLEKWKVRQGILAALTHPKAREVKDVNELLTMLERDAEQESKQAAERGTAVHGVVEQYFNNVEKIGKAFADSMISHVRDSVGPIIDALWRLSSGPWRAEVVVASEHGFAGRVDLTAPGVVVDVKGRNFEPGATPVVYPDQGMQLAAYREALGEKQALCFNVFFSRSHPGEVCVHAWKPVLMERYWRAFYALLAFYKTLNNL